MAYPEKAARSVDELRRANAAINQRLEAQEDSYRAQGMGDEEIQDRLAADKWNFQKEYSILLEFPKRLVLAIQCSLKE